MMDCVRAAPAVINAFAAMGIFVAIFAVAASDLFADRDPDNFGTFFRALFSMFQVCAARCMLCMYTAREMKRLQLKRLQQIYRIKCQCIRFLARQSSFCVSSVSWNLLKSQRMSAGGAPSLGRTTGHFG
jgi:hypothetical protein